MFCSALPFPQSVAAEEGSVTASSMRAQPCPDVLIWNCPRWLSALGGQPKVVLAWKVVGWRAPRSEPGSSPGAQSSALGRCLLGGQAADWPFHALHDSEAWKA